MGFSSLREVPALVLDMLCILRGMTTQMLSLPTGINALEDKTKNLPAAENKTAAIGAAVNAALGERDSKTPVWA